MWYNQRRSPYLYWLFITHLISSDLFHRLRLRFPPQNTHIQSTRKSSYFLILSCWAAWNTSQIAILTRGLCKRRNHSRACLLPQLQHLSFFLSSISAPVQWQQPIRISCHEGMAQMPHTYMSTQGGWVAWTYPAMWSSLGPSTFPWASWQSHYSVAGLPRSAMPIYAKSPHLAQTSASRAFGPRNNQHGGPTSRNTSSTLH